MTEHHGHELLTQFGLYHPDRTGSSEYRAIFDAVADALYSTDETDDEEGTREIILSMLNEFDGWIGQMRAAVEGQVARP